MTEYSARLFDLSGRVAVVTGGSGVLGGAMAMGLAEAGARVGVAARSGERVDRMVRDIEEAGGTAMALLADVLQVDDLRKARDTVLETWGSIDILVNAAGGNIPEATVNATHSFFDVDPDAWRAVIDLNLLGTILPCQVFAEMMGSSSHEGGGAIVNVSSMAADRALTHVGGYGAAKAGVESFTRWLAVEMARSHGRNVRVNAIAPGFFVGDQNRALLLDGEGGLTERGATIIGRTPAGRFGEPHDLVGTLLWLCSRASRFVTGIVVPVDGGFGAFSGV